MHGTPNGTECCNIERSQEFLFSRRAYGSLSAAHKHDSCTSTPRNMRVLLARQVFDGVVGLQCHAGFVSQFKGSLVTP